MISLDIETLRCLFSKDVIYIECFNATMTPFVKDAQGGIWHSSFFYARKRILMNNSPMISKDDYIHLVAKHIQKLITPLEFEEYIYIDFNQNNDLMLSIDIDKGGASGGSYMGHSVHGYSGYVKNDPDFYSVVHDILSDMNHNGSYRVIYDAIKTCQSKKRREEREYYGNYSVREIIKFDFMKFYSFLYP